MKKYDHKEIEQKWQDAWDKAGVYKTKDDTTKEKFYILDMFPYPSGDGLHMGHTEGYTATDILYRFKKMMGYNVLHPQGFDSFGLPAENYAIKTGTHPSKTTKVNSETYIQQMKMLGLGHDLDHLVYTSSPEYYRWTQWLFGKFFEHGLVEQKTDTINWCPSCNTGIANEQVEQGACERCKTDIEQKDVKGWFFKITDFAEELIADLDTVDWPETTKKNQRNWIGKSEGVEIDFKVKDIEDTITVFTTRPDTLFGATFMVLAPEHELVTKVLNDLENSDDVAQYVKTSKNKTERERREAKKKTGVELEGIKAINPANNEEIPVYIADHVLGGYGTGAIMAVPAHSDSDLEFAQRFGLKEQIVVKDENDFAWGDDCNISMEERRNITFEKQKKNLKNGIAYTDTGLLINSGNFSGHYSTTAGRDIAKSVGGKMTTNYRLRDWSLSRQRYWGCPIPIAYDEKGDAKYVGDENLPWTLPEDVDFVPTGEAPLTLSKELKNRTEELFGAGWCPEVDTMDTFVDSAWYFLRYPDTENAEEFCSPEMLKHWAPVDLYIGGAEHTNMHLLYARFFIKAMKKMGLVDFNEPFLQLRHQGMVLDKDGVKMSKSKGNVVNPNDMVAKFGADAVRLNMMFVGPLEDDVMWDEDAVIGVSRFINKVWKSQEYVTEASSLGVLKELHKTIKKVGEDIEGLKYNTAIAQMMILVNIIEKEKSITKEDFGSFLKIVSPFAPHMAQELWAGLGNESFLIEEQWPSYDESLLKEDTYTLAVQVNGKVRAEIVVAIDAKEDEVKALALENDAVDKWIKQSGKIIGNGEIKRFIYVTGRLANFVVQ